MLFVRWLVASFFDRICIWIYLLALTYGWEGWEVGGSGYEYMTDGNDWNGIMDGRKSGLHVDLQDTLSYEMQCVAVGVDS